MTFSTERNDALWWLMVSADVNANRALLAVLADAGWREDVGRMVRGTLSRQKRGHLGYHRRQCLGRRGDEPLQRGVREDAGLGRRGREARRRGRADPAAAA